MEHEAMGCGSFQIPNPLAATRTPLSFSEQERPIEARDGDGHQFDGDQQPTDDGLGCWGGEDEMQSEEFRSL